MKILYFFKEKNLPMYLWQRFHIFNELEVHGCEIEVFNPLDFQTVEEANEKLLLKVHNTKYDLFMTPYNEDILYIETLKLIKNLGLPTLLICFDNLIVPYKHKNVAKYYDVVWLTSQETAEKFKKWGANIIFNPYAANPYNFQPTGDREVEKVAFIGTPYGSRVNMINSLTQSNIEVDLYSNHNIKTKEENRKIKKGNLLKPGIDLMKFDIGRKIILGAMKQKITKEYELEESAESLTLKNSVNLTELSRLYSNYALSLSSTAARNTGVLSSPVNIVNLRSFEIPMSGGLQICSYFDELANYFEEDKEIIFYRSKDEFIEKTRFYLKPENKVIRNKMKNEARKRAINDHSWFVRFEKVFNYLGLAYK